MMPSKSGFFCAEEADTHEKARREWLEAERLQSAVHQVRQGGFEVSSDVRFEGQSDLSKPASNVLGAFDDVLSDRRFADTETADQAEQDHFQNPSMGHRVFQYFKLLFGHRNSPVLQSGNGSQHGDSIKANSSTKGAA